MQYRCYLVPISIERDFDMDQVDHDSDIVIEMIVYDNADDAEKVLEEHIKSFNLLKSTGAAEKKQTGDNYHKYFLISNNYYMVSSRIDNTLIFCKTLVTNKESVDKVLDELGY